MRHAGTIRSQRRAAIETGLLAVAGLLVPPACVFAQSFPAKPIRLVVPYAPGGFADVTARIVSTRLSQALGQPVVIDNKPGNSGIAGASVAARSAADGYTLLIGYTSEMVISPTLVDVSYKTERDFRPIAFAGSNPLLLVAGASTGVRSLRDLIARAKEQPGKISYASAGNGSPAHIAGALLAKAHNLDILHVPYKGGAQAVTDVMAGNVSIYFSGLPPALPLVRAGRLHPLGVTSLTPSPRLPDVTALASSGYPEMDMVGWLAFFVPAGTPVGPTQVLHDKLNEVLAEPEVRASLLEQGVEGKLLSNEELQAFMTREHAKYASLVRTLGITQVN